MKNEDPAPPSMVLIIFLFGLIALFMFGGCTAKRAAITTLGGGAGGAIGYVASEGDPLYTGIGAAAGAGLTHLAQGEDTDTAAKHFKIGYDRGQGDSIKRHYWLVQAQQRRESEVGGRQYYYTIPAPADPTGPERVDHSITVPVVE